jgi:hypothetical protein
VENATCTGAEAILTAVYNWTSDDKLSPDPSSMLASYLTNANLRFLVHTGIASSLVRPLNLFFSARPFRRASN